MADIWKIKMVSEKAHCECIYKMIYFHLGLWMDVCLVR